MTDATARAATVWNWAAFALIAAFVVLQAATLGYGTRINDLPYIRDYRVTGDVFQRSGLNRNQLVGSSTQQIETPDLWMTRFKLYSIEADEVVAIIALGRIKPANLQFDPGFYQYGGAFLYPLGAWYVALSKLGAIHIATLDQMLAIPDSMDRVWIAGRAFVLAAFAMSAVLLFLALIELAPRRVALAALAIYLFCPASIMFSQVIKPHWYALMWVNAVLLILVRTALRNRLPPVSELLLAVSLGLAVGSALTFAVFAVLVWVALALLAVRGTLGVAALIRIPLVSIAAFLLSNPYYLLNWPAVQAERTAAESWFEPSFSPGALFVFVENSLFSGFGVAFTLLLIAITTWHLARGSLSARLLAIGIFAPICIVAAITANLAAWNLNFRYISYAIPAALLLLAAWPWRFRTPALFLCAAATILQTAPLKLAYFDENSTTHSTRLAAAAWINSHVPETDAICVSTPTLVPFDVPPFRLDRYQINAPDCRWRVRVERQLRTVHILPDTSIAQRFRPRLSPEFFPLVWEHINPQITVYRKND